MSGADDAQPDQLDAAARATVAAATKAAHDQAAQALALLRPALARAAPAVAANRRATGADVDTEAVLKYAKQLSYGAFAPPAFLLRGQLVPPYRAPAPQIEIMKRRIF